MKASPILIVLVVLALSSIFACAGFVTIGRQHYSSQEREANDFVSPVLVAYLRSWDPKELERAGSRHFKNNSPEDILGAWSSRFEKKLGRVTKLRAGQLTGMNASFGSRQALSQMTLEYPAEFEFGPATIVVTVVREDGALKLNRLFINSPALAEDQSNAKR